MLSAQIPAGSCLVFVDVGGREDMATDWIELKVNVLGADEVRTALWGSFVGNHQQKLSLQLAGHPGRAA